MLCRVNRQTALHHLLEDVHRPHPLPIPDGRVDEKVKRFDPVHHRLNTSQCNLGLLPRGPAGVDVLLLGFEPVAQHAYRRVESESLVPLLHAHVSLDQDAVCRNVRRQAVRLHQVHDLSSRIHVAALAVDPDHHVESLAASQALERQQPAEHAGGVVVEAGLRQAHEGQGVVLRLRPDAVLPHLRQEPQGELHLPCGDHGADKGAVRVAVPRDASVAHAVRNPQRLGELTGSAVTLDQHVVVRGARLDAHPLHDAEQLSALLGPIRTVPHARRH
mmetsp:Transcript_64788/g.198140  ORF Transcript_64788/g.198140 Transcript_64788/m.198140 type:complete len:274 (-) Transcript_64788:820-1641(-)